VGDLGFRHLTRALCLASGIFAVACAPARLTLPTDAGSPLSNLADVHAQVSRACRGVRTFTAELALAGHAGRTRLRGRVVTLLLPRDDRVLNAERPEDVLGALTGVSLAPADLHAILTGCVVPDPTPRGGRVHANGMASIDLDGDAVLYLARVNGAWQPRAASRQGWDVQYSNWQGDFPRTVALRSMANGLDVELSADVSQLESNVPLDAAAFAVQVPPSAGRLTLAELREAGPLRDVAAGERP